MRIVGGYQDTRSNNEDFAITPYLCGVWHKGKIIKVAGLGICWGWASFYIGLVSGLPKKSKGFIIIRKHK